MQWTIRTCNLLLKPLNNLEKQHNFQRYYDVICCKYYKVRGLFDFKLVRYYRGLRKELHTYVFTQDF